jgi:hypothetical protein
MTYILLTGTQIKEAFEQATGEKLTEVLFNHNGEKVTEVKLIIDLKHVKKQNNEKLQS